MLINSLGVKPSQLQKVVFTLQIVPFTSVVTKPQGAQSNDDDRSGMLFIVAFFIHKTV
ncbi:hypothetical protein GPLA_3666 [Paraglaciecola polaris LMG 21857]|uniref:Uncharacterized protein n=1 Tax=Paraglaciecola polaris LMG 21857 TaxID=1129793 RepID=K6ZEN4_9ALTE|nr:hypothetical protein GPLA_3666 [Paraglaciecola polaris LMG 21857]